VSRFNFAVFQERRGDWNDSASPDLILFFRRAGNDFRPEL
jgi:hypothetical protein